MNLEQKLLCLAESYEDLAEYYGSKKPMTDWLNGNNKASAEIYARVAKTVRRILKEEGREASA